VSQQVHYALSGPLRWRNLDGQWLVHCCASGATMVADPVDAALLEWLGDGPASAADLALRLEVASGAQMPPDSQQGIDERLQAWLQHGWVDVMDD